MNFPLVSIILSTYNGARHIKESLDSVLNQTYKNFEFVIINDASQDIVEDIILEYKNIDSRIIYIKNKNNLGLTKSLNIGISQSQGKYIARIDDDDIWSDKEKLIKQVNYLEENPKCGLCGTGIILINEAGKITTKIMNRESDIMIRNHISQSNQFAHSSIMMRKSVLDNVGYYTDKDYCRYTEDYDLWLRIGIVSTFYNIPEYSVKYRVREGSISGKKSFKQLSNAFRAYLKHRKNYPRQVRGILAHIITFTMPKKIINIFIKINNTFQK